MRISKVLLVSFILLLVIALSVGQKGKDPKGGNGPGGNGKGTGNSSSTGNNGGTTSSNSPPGKNKPPKKDPKPPRDLEPVPKKQPIAPNGPAQVTVSSRTNNNTLCVVSIPQDPKLANKSVAVQPVNQTRLKDVFFPSKKSKDDLSYILSTVFNIDIVEENDTVIPSTFVDAVKFSFLVTPENSDMSYTGLVCLAYIDTVTNSWVCVQNFTYDGTDAYINGSVNHFTEFGVLLLIPDQDDVGDNVVLDDTDKEVTPIIVGCVIGGVVFVALIVATVIGLRIRKEKRETDEEIRRKTQRITQLIASPSEISETSSTNSV